MAAKKKSRAKKRASKKMKSRDPLEQMREIINAWPETNERLSHGSPTFWGGKKTFASLASNHHGDGRIAAWIKSNFDAQAELVQLDPEIFFVPQYVGPSGWVGVRLDRELDWSVVAALLEEGYRSVAPKRAIKLLDEAQGEE